MHGDEPKAKNARQLLPHRVLFPLAALYAAIAVPLWLVIRATDSAVTVATWHGHEMLFGFALAVIAGFLATRPSQAAVWILAGTWLAARVAAVAGSGPPALVVGIGFAVATLAVTLPPLWKGAKRWENRIPPAILAALVAADASWWAGAVWFGPQWQVQVLLATVDLISLLLLVVGGRALRAAAGGYLQRQGLARRDRRQGRYELPLAALVAAAALCDVLALGAVAGALCIAAAGLTVVRVIPWQLHRTLSHPPLWTLALGYLWLVPGLAAKGTAQLGATVAVTDMLHGIGVGALGTLTLVMMARTALLRARKPIAAFGDIAMAALLISAAALSRLLVACLPELQHGLLWLAAAAWTSAFVILFARLWRAM